MSNPIKRVTLKRVMSWRPCSGYTLERVEQLLAGRKYVTPRGIAKLEIPPEDRLWALLNCMTGKQQHAVACDFAETVLHLCPEVIGYTGGTP